MPMSVKDLGVEGEVYANPVIGKADHTAPVLVDVSALTAAEVDEDGYLIPGVVLKRNGTVIAAPVAAATPGYGIVHEAVKVADSNVAGVLAVADNVTVAVVTIGQVNRAIIEDNLARALNANELAAFDQAGSSFIVYIY